MMMKGDNMAANLIANCQASVRKVRHIDLASLFVRTVTENGLLKVEHVDSAENLADILTKVLGEQRVRSLLTGLCLQMINADGGA